MEPINIDTKQIYYAAATSSGGTAWQLVRIGLSALDDAHWRFWKTFLEALSSWNIAFSQKQYQAGFPASEKALHRFMNALEEEVKAAPLIIDINNCHVIQNYQVRHFLEQLVTFKADHLYVLLVSADSGQAKTLEAAQTDKNHYLLPEEELSYYKDMGIYLQEKEFSAIREFTDGWGNAAVTFAQKYLLIRDPKAIFKDFGSWIFQWVEDIHTNYYNPEERRFFICLTLLDDFPLALIKAISGWTEEETERIFEASPFVRSKGGGRLYFEKYTRQYLIRNLYSLEKKARSRFLVQVGQWYGEQGFKIDAVYCYRKANANTKILQALGQWRLPESWAHASCYLETIQAMPDSFLDSHPLLYVLLGYSMCTLRRYGEAESLMEIFCLKNDGGRDTPEEIRSVLGEAYLLWTYCAMIQLKPDQIIKRAKKASALLPGGTAVFRNRLNRQSDIPSFLFSSPAAGSVQRSLAYAKELAPDLDKALCGGATGIASLAEGEIHFYTRNFKEVEKSAWLAIQKGQTTDQYDVVCSAYFLLMRYHLAKGNYEKLMENLGLLKETAEKAGRNLFFSMPDLAESWVALKMGKKHKVAEWIIDERKHQQFTSPFYYGRDYVIRCGYLLENQLFTELLVLAESVIKIFQSRGLNLLALHIMLMQAFAYNGIHEQRQAMGLFEEVYRWIHENNLIMVCVEYGSYMQALAAAYASEGNGFIPNEWIEMIIKKSKSYQTYLYTVRKKYNQKKSSGISLLESLTSAEQKVLLMIYMGMTTKQIAEIQNKSAGAVRSMLRYIYEKIGAGNKADAARIAAEYNIKQYVKI